MTATFFERAYATTDQAAVEALYDDWAAVYDADVAENGYQTPARCAEALAACLPDHTAPILDFACGTGLSGAALAAQGFTAIDGVDLSAAMLRAAADRGVYRALTKADPDATPDARPGDYAAVAAVGALSPGAAPAGYFDRLLGLLAPGGLLVLSFNDHTLKLPDYTDRLDRAVADEAAVLRFQESGPHIVKLGLASTVYVLERR